VTSRGTGALPLGKTQPGTAAVGTPLNSARTSLRTIVRPFAPVPAEDFTLQRPAGNYPTARLGIGCRLTHGRRIPRSGPATATGGRRLLCRTNVNHQFVTRCRNCHRPRGGTASKEHSEVAAEPNPELASVTRHLSDPALRPSDRQRSRKSTGSPSSDRSQNLDRASSLRSLCVTAVLRRSATSPSRRPC
jgi:hypothetical protein